MVWTGSQIRNALVHVCPPLTSVVCVFADVFPNSHGPTPWFLAAWNAMAVDQFAQKPADNPAGNPADNPEGGTSAKDINEKALKKKTGSNKRIKSQSVEERLDSNCCVTSDGR